MFYLICDFGLKRIIPQKKNVLKSQSNAKLSKHMTTKLNFDVFFGKFMFSK